MKKIILIMNIIFITSTINVLSNNTEALVSLITQDINAIKEQQNNNLIEEIDSPAIQQEKVQKIQRQIKSLIQHAQQLDAVIAMQPLSHTMWQEKQLSLLAPAKSELKQAIQQNIKSTWQQNAGTILSMAGQATLAGVTTGLIMFSYQALQQGTGNLSSFNTNTLMTSALSSASANLIAASSKALTGSLTTSTALSSMGANVLTQALFMPSVQAKSYQVTMPAFTGIIQSWIVGEAIATINTMFEQNGEIAQAIQQVNVKQIAFGKEITPMSNSLVSATLPKVQNVINNRNLALALTEIGWVSFQSATVGGLLYAAGLGYAGAGIANSINYAMLFGMAQGTLTNVAAMVNRYTPGAVLNITSVPLTQYVATLAGTTVSSTPQTALTDVLQAITTEATNFMINESDKNGGLWEVLKKGKNALGSAITSRWSNIWGAVSEAFATIQEIEPLPY